MATVPTFSGVLTGTGTGAAAGAGSDVGKGAGKGIVGATAGAANARCSQRYRAKSPTAIHPSVIMFRSLACSGRQRQSHPNARDEVHGCDHHRARPTECDPGSMLGRACRDGKSLGTGNRSLPKGIRSMRAPIVVDEKIAPSLRLTLLRSRIPLAEIPEARHRRSQRTGGNCPCACAWANRRWYSASRRCSVAA